MFLERETVAVANLTNGASDMWKIKKGTVRKNTTTTWISRHQKHEESNTTWAALYHTTTNANRCADHHGSIHHLQR